MHATLGGGNCDLPVSEIGRCDSDRVRTSVVQQGVEVVVDLNTQALGRRPRTRRRISDPDNIRVSGDGSGEQMPSDACTHDAHTDHKIALLLVNKVGLFLPTLSKPLAQVQGRTRSADTAWLGDQPSAPAC